MQKRIIISLLILIFFLGGIVWIRTIKNRPQPLETSMVLIRDVTKSIHVNATLSSRNEATISTELPTRIEKVMVDVNDTVTAGQELLRLDRAAINAQIRRAQLAVERAVLAEQQARLPSRHMSKKDILSFKKATEQARQVVRELYAQAKKTSLRAPIDGVVVVQNAHVGEIAQGLLMRIVDPTSLRLEALIPEVDIAHVHPGDSVRIVFDAYLDRSVAGTITTVDAGSTSLQNIVYYRAEVAIDPDTMHDIDLRDGMSAEVDIITQQKKNTHSLPRDFVAKDEQGYYVFVVDPRDKTGVRKQYITPGLLGDQRVEVLDGLSEHQEVVRIHEGQ